MSKVRIKLNPQSSTKIKISSQGNIKVIVTPNLTKIKVDPNI